MRRQQEILDTVDHFIRRINLGALTKGSKFTIPYTLSVGRPQSEGENVDIDHSIHFKLLNKDKRVISELSKQYTQNKRAVADYFDHLSVSQQYTKLPDGQVKVGSWEISKNKKTSSQLHGYDITLARNNTRYQNTDISKDNLKSLFMTLPKGYKIASSKFELQSDGRYKYTGYLNTDRHHHDIGFNLVSNYETLDIPAEATIKVEYNDIVYDYTFKQRWEKYNETPSDITVYSDSEASPKMFYDDVAYKGAQINNKLSIHQNNLDNSEAAITQIAITRNQRDDGQYFDLANIRFDDNRFDHAKVYGLPDTYEFAEGVQFNTEAGRRAYESQLVELGTVSTLRNEQLKGYQLLVMKFEKSMLINDVSLRFDGVLPEGVTEEQVLAANYNFSYDVQFQFSEDELRHETGSSYSTGFRKFTTVEINANNDDPRSIELNQPHSFSGNIRGGSTHEDDLPPRGAVTVEEVTFNVKVPIGVTVDVPSEYTRSEEAGYVTYTWNRGAMDILDYRQAIKNFQTTFTPGLGVFSKATSTGEVTFPVEFFTTHKANPFVTGTGLRQVNQYTVRSATGELIDMLVKTERSDGYRSTLSASQSKLLKGDTVTLRGGLYNLSGNRIDDRSVVFTLPKKDGYDVSGAPLNSSDTLRLERIGDVDTRFEIQTTTDTLTEQTSLDTITWRDGVGDDLSAITAVRYNLKEGAVLNAYEFVEFELMGRFVERSGGDQLVSHITSYKKSTNQKLNTITSEVTIPKLYLTPKLTINNTELDEFTKNSLVTELSINHSAFGNVTVSTADNPDDGGRLAYELIDQLNSSPEVTKLAMKGIRNTLESLGYEYSLDSNELGTLEWDDLRGGYKQPWHVGFHINFPSFVSRHIIEGDHGTRTTLFDLDGRRIWEDNTADFLSANLHAPAEFSQRINYLAYPLNTNMQLISLLNHVQQSNHSKDELYYGLSRIIQYGYLPQDRLKELYDIGVFRNNLLDDPNFELNSIEELPEIKSVFSNTSEYLFEIPAHNIKITVDDLVRESIYSSISKYIQFESILHPFKDQISRRQFLEHLTQEGFITQKADYEKNKHKLFIPEEYGDFNDYEKLLREDNTYQSTLQTLALFRDFLSIKQFKLPDASATGEPPVSTQVYHNEVPKSYVTYVDVDTGEILGHDDLSVRVMSHEAMGGTEYSFTYPSYIDDEKFTYDERGHIIGAQDKGKYVTLKDGRKYSVVGSYASRLFEAVKEGLSAQGTDLGNKTIEEATNEIMHTDQLKAEKQAGEDQIAQYVGEDKLADLFSQFQVQEVIKYLQENPAIKKELGHKELLYYQSAQYKGNGKPPVHFLSKGAGYKHREIANKNAWGPHNGNRIINTEIVMVQQARGYGASYEFVDQAGNVLKQGTLVEPNKLLGTPYEVDVPTIYSVSDGDQVTHYRLKTDLKTISPTGNTNDQAPVQLTFEYEKVDLQVTRTYHLDKPIERIPDVNLPDGEVRVEQEGKDGLEEVVYEVFLNTETGELDHSRRRVISRTTITQPVKRVERVGVQPKSNAFETYIETIPYDVQTTNDATLYVGMQVVETEGVVGERTTKTPLVFRNGELVRDEDQQTVEVTRDKVDKVVRVGTKPFPNFETMQNEINTLKSDLGEANKQIKALDGRVGANEGEIGAIQTNITELQNKLAEQEKQLGELQTETGRLDEAIKATDGKVDELAKTVNDKEQALQESINGLRNELDAEKGKLNDAINRIGKNERDIKSLQDRASDLETRATNLEDRANNLDTKVQNLDNELKQEVAGRHQAINDVKTQIERTKQELENTIGENKQALEGKLTELEGKLNDESSKLDDLDKRVTSNEANIAGLKGKVDNLNRQVNDLEKQSNDLQASIDMLDESMKDALQEEIDERQKAITRLQNELGAVEEALETADEQTNERIDELGKQLADEANKLNDLTERVQTNETNIQENAEAIKALQEKANNLETRATNLEQQVNNLNTKVQNLDDELKQEVADRKQAINDLQDKINTAKEELQNASTANKQALENTLNKLRNDLNTEKGKLNDLTKRVETNESNIKELAKTAVGLIDEADRIIGLINNLEVKASDLDKSLQNEVKDRQQAIENVKSQLEDTKQALENNANANKQELEKRLTNLSNELSTEKDKLNDLTKRVETNESNIKELAKTAVGLIDEADRIIGLINNLEVKASDLDKSLQNEVKDRQQAIENVKSQLEDTKQALENNANANKQELEKRLTNLSNELSTEKDKLNDLTKRVETNESNIKELAKTAVGLIDEADRIIGLINNLEVKASDLDKSLQNEVKDRQQAIENVKSQIEETQKQLQNEANVNKQALEKRLANLQQEVTEQGQAIESLAKKVQEEVDRLDKKDNDLQTQINKEIEERIKDVNALQTDIDRLANNQMNLSNELKQEINNRKAAINNLFTEINNIKIELTQSGASTEALERQLAELRAELQAEKTRTDNLSKRVSENETQIRGLNQRADQIEQDATQLTERVTALEGKLRGLDEKVTQEIADRKQAIANISVQIFNIKQELQSSTKDMEALERRLNELSAELGVEKERLSNLIIQVNDHERRITALEKRVTAAETDLSRLAGHIGDLEVTVGSLNDQLQQEVKNRKQAINEIYAEIERLKASFTTAISDIRQELTQRLDKLEKALAEQEKALIELDLRVKFEIDRLNKQKNKPEDNTGNNSNAGSDQSGKPGTEQPGTSDQETTPGTGTGSGTEVGDGSKPGTEQPGTSDQETTPDTGTGSGTEVGDGSKPETEQSGTNDQETTPGTGTGSGTEVGDDSKPETEQPGTSDQETTPGTGTGSGTEVGDDSKPGTEQAPTEQPGAQYEFNKGSSLIHEKPHFPQAELDKLVAIERDKYAGKIQTLPNLTQEQKDQLTAELNKAGTVPVFDTILDKAQAWNTTQASEGEGVKPDAGEMDTRPAEQPEGSQSSETDQAVEEKLRPTKPELDPGKYMQSNPSSETVTDSGRKPAQPTVTQADLMGGTHQVPSERLPETATDSWILAIASLVSLSSGAVLSVKKKEDNEEE